MRYMYRHVAAVVARATRAYTLVGLPAAVINIHKMSNHVQPSPAEKLCYEQLEVIVTFIRTQTSIVPEIGIICGSGLGGLADQLQKEHPIVTLPYHDIPNFPTCNVKGHAGELVFGYLSGVPTVCMKGRFHFYEGHAPWKVTMPVRVMKLLGVRTLIVTNAAGGLNTTFSNGDIVLIKDHINMVGMTGHHPLVGENEERFGERFPAMTAAYDRELGVLMSRTAHELQMDDYYKAGVYVYLSGPSYETPAEARFLRMVGADAVGMSTVPEVIVARHCGIRVVGLSLITNMVIQDPDSHAPQPNHKDVVATSNMRAKDVERLVVAFLKKLGDCNQAPPS